MDSVRLIDNSADSSQLGLLRRAVVDLASVRFDKFFHASTGTHIIRQLEGTELNTIPITGYGEFADEAYDNYLSRLETAVLDKGEAELSEIVSSLKEVPVAINKKLEFQIEVSDALRTDLIRQSRQKGISLSAYIADLVLRELPLQSDPSQLNSWLESIRNHTELISNQDEGIQSSSRTLELSLAASDASRIAEIAYATKSGSINHLVRDLIVIQSQRQHQMGQ